jgi:predicted double-glycine peptidase
MRHINGRNKVKHAIAVLGLTAIGCCGARADNRYVVTQSTPSDCGPAALATLLRYYLDVPTTEAEMVSLTHATYRFGTTLLKLEEVAKAKGCTADSFRMTLPVLRQQMATYPGPVIVRTLLPEPHFSVLLAVEPDAVLVADPAAGNILIRPEAFLSRWYIPGTEEGFVFIAARSDDHLNTAHYHEAIQRLERQLRNLKTAPLQAPPFRR